MANKLNGHTAGTETQRVQKDGRNEGQQWQRGAGGGGSERVKGWGGNLESIRWLRWSCLHSCGGESGRNAREGTRVWVLCHKCMYYTNTTSQKELHYIPVRYLLSHCPRASSVYLHVSVRLFPPTAALGLVESSCSQRSPTSPVLRSQWRVRMGGWHRPRPCQHSSSQYSLTQLPLITSLHTKFTALLFSITGSDDGGIWLKKKKKKE